MALSRVSKLDAARMQLDAAADLFLRGKYIPAITLAAAAEEILARLLPPGAQSSQSELLPLLVASLGVSEQVARDQYLNNTRNALKHHSNNAESTIELDAHIDAKVWIVRAFNNYVKLDSNLPPSLQSFMNSYKPIVGGASAI